MDRETQREISVLGSRIRDGRAAARTTAPDTIHAPADLIELIAAEKIHVFRDYSAKERRRMAKEGRAMPDGSYPIGNCSDAKNAIQSIGRAKPGKRNSVVAHIKKRVRALSCTGKIFDKYK